MAKSKSEWKLISDYPITKYQCGIRAGERVRLRQELVVRDDRGEPTRVHRAGDIWTVLSGAAEQPGVIWLRQPNGERHTWDDGDIFWTSFERIDDNAT